MSTDYERGYNSGYVAGKRSVLGSDGHTHRYRVSENQADTGKAGVRMNCKCGSETVELNLDLHRKLAREEAK